MMLARLVAASFGAVLLATLVTMVVFLACFGRAVGDDGERRGGPEAEEHGKLVFAPVWMILVASALGILGWKVLKAPTTFRMGYFGGALIMYANLALVSTFYFWNLASEEENQNRFLEDGNGGNGNEEEEQEGRAAFILSILCLVLSIVYTLLAGFVLGASNFAHDHGIDETDATQSNAHVDILSDAWKFLSIFSILAVGVTFIIAITSLFLEDAERMREEGDVWNFLLIIVWMLLVVAAFLIAGNRVFRRSGMISQLEIGIFNGAIYFFSGMTFLLAGLYGFSFRFGEEWRRGGREEEVVGSLWFAFLCFTFTVIYVAFAALVAKYHPSVLHVNGCSMDSSNMFLEMGEGGQEHAAQRDSKGAGGSLSTWLNTDKKNTSAHKPTPMEKNSDAQMA